MSATTEWVRRYYAALDDKDLAACMAYWGPDSVMRHGNEEPLIGVAAIEEKTREMFSLFETVEHDFVGLWEPEPGLLVAEVALSYKLAGGSQVSFPGVNISKVEPDHWVEQRVYVDLAPLTAAIGAAPERSFQDAV